MEGMKRLWEGEGTAGGPAEKGQIAPPGAEGWGGWGWLEGRKSKRRCAEDALMEEGYLQQQAAEVTSVPSVV